MATVEWQSTCTDLKQRGSFLLKTEELTDCTLLVGPEAVPFKSHKLMLAMASPVFESMFFDGASSEETTFHIPDLHPETFEALVLYIYTENININSYKQAYRLYLAANKYLIPQLVRVCAEFMCDNVSMETACPTYAAANKYQDHALMFESLHMIKLHIKEVLNHRSFDETDIDTVAAIFGIPDIQVEEMELFQALERYAMAQSSRKRSASPSPDQSGQEAATRDLVHKALKQIRFLTFTLEQFARGPARSGLLSQGDALGLMVGIAGDATGIPPGFSPSRQHRIPRGTPPPPVVAPTHGLLRVSATAMLLRSRSHSSSRVMVASRPWVLRVIPHLQTDTNSNAVIYLAMVLRCEDQDPQPWVCSAWVEFTLLAAEGKPNFITIVNKTFSSAQRECGKILFMTVDDALNPEKGYVQGLNLVFEAHLTVVEKPTSRQTI